MSKVCVNGSFIVEGEFSFGVAYDMTQNPPLIKIEASFASSSGYIPEIMTLENDRYVVNGIHVTQDSFRSEEDTMLYNFTAKAFGMTDALKEVKYLG